MKLDLTNGSCIHISNGYFVVVLLFAFCNHHQLYRCCCRSIRLIRISWKLEWQLFSSTSFFLLLFLFLSFISSLRIFNVFQRKQKVMVVVGMRRLNNLFHFKSRYGQNEYIKSKKTKQQNKGNIEEVLTLICLWLH